MRVLTLVTISLISFQLSAQTLLFKSGFEDTVKLSDPVAVSGQWYQYFIGQDLSSGYNWPQDLPTNDTLDGYWTFKVPDTEVLDSFARVAIDTVIGHDGNTTRAAYMELRDYDGSNFGNTMAGHVRCEYRLNVDSTRKQYYMKYWMKVQDNMYTDIMPYGSNRWRIIMEWFETGDGHSDYRWSLKNRCGLFATDSTSSFVSLANQYQMTPFGGFITDTALNQLKLLPVNDWFKVETFWRQALDSTGHIWIAIDGDTLIDYKGRNMNDSFPSRMSNWQIMKLYTDTVSMDQGLVYQWIDDVEIWDTVPGTLGIDPMTVPDEFIRVYPNPATDELNITHSSELKLNAKALRFYNSMGQQLNLPITTENETLKIDISSLKPGVYICVVLSDTGAVLRRERFIKE